MASFDEVQAIISQDVGETAGILRNRVGAACRVAAQQILVEDPLTTNHAQRVKWAIQVLSSYNATLDQMFTVVVVANIGFTQAQILGASESAIQTNVNASIDALSANLV